MSKENYNDFIGESEVKQMKYSSIIKKPLFWIAVIVFFITQIIKFKIKYEKILVAQYIGVLISSFILVWIFGIIFLAIIKKINENKK